MKHVKVSDGITPRPRKGSLLLSSSYNPTNERNVTLTNKYISTNS